MPARMNGDSRIEGSSELIWNKEYWPNVLFGLGCGLLFFAAVFLQVKVRTGFVHGAAIVGCAMAVAVALIVGPKILPVIACPAGAWLIYSITPITLYGACCHESLLSVVAYVIILSGTLMVGANYLVNEK